MSSRLFIEVPESRPPYCITHIRHSSDSRCYPLDTLNEPRRGFSIVGRYEHENFIDIDKGTALIPQVMHVDSA